jgi:hypothetical protein
MGTVEDGRALYDRMHGHGSNADLARAIQRGVAAALRDGDPDEAEAARVKAEREAKAAAHAEQVEKNRADFQRGADLARAEAEAVRRGVSVGAALYDLRHPPRDQDGAA